MALLRKWLVRNIGDVGLVVDVIVLQGQCARFLCEDLMSIVVRAPISATLMTACLALAGCDLFAPSAPTAPTATTTPSEVKTAAPFVAADGQPETRPPLAQEDPGVTALGVAKFNDLPNISKVASVRVFGMGGGDPAMNGLKTYLAFVSPHDARGFLLGDFYDYRVIAASPGRIDLEIDEHVMSDTNEIAQRTRRVIVSWTETPQKESPNPEYPSTVTVTPAK